jgi:hypothetical protein
MGNDFPLFFRYNFQDVWQAHVYFRVWRGDFSFDPRYLQFFLFRVAAMDALGVIHITGGRRFSGHIGRQHT